MDTQKLIELKAEIFDLQIEYSRIKTRLEEKLKELNRVNGAKDDK